jgi:hypothetical protein
MFGHSNRSIFRERARTHGLSDFGVSKLLWVVPSQTSLTSGRLDALGNPPAGPGSEPFG